MFWPTQCPVIFSKGNSNMSNLTCTVHQNHRLKLGLLHLCGKKYVGLQPCAKTIVLLMLLTGQQAYRVSADGRQVVVAALHMDDNRGWTGQTDHVPVVLGLHHHGEHFSHLSTELVRFVFFFLLLWSVYLAFPKSRVIDYICILLVSVKTLQNKNSSYDAMLWTACSVYRHLPRGPNTLWRKSIRTHRWKTLCLECLEPQTWFHSGMLNLASLSGLYQRLLQSGGVSLLGHDMK